MSEEQKEKGTFIHGIAASEHLDSSGERIRVDGIDISSLTKDGVFNFEHQSKEASAIVGKITHAKKILKESDCDNESHKYFWNKIKMPYLYVAGELFDVDGHQAAKDVAAMLKYDNRNKDKKESKRLINFSIEGSRLEKKGAEILKSIARKISITITPCNKVCEAEELKPEEIENAQKMKKFGEHQNTFSMIQDLMGKSEEHFASCETMEKTNWGEMGMGATIKAEMPKPSITNEIGDISKPNKGFGGIKDATPKPEKPDYGKVIVKSKKKKVTMTAKEAVKEHEELVDVLDSKSHKDDKKEAKKQRKELKEYKKKLDKTEPKEDLYHIHEGNQQITSKPATLGEIQRIHGKIKDLEGKGFRVLQHKPKLAINKAEDLEKKEFFNRISNKFNQMKQRHAVNQTAKRMQRERQSTGQEFDRDKTVIANKDKTTMGSGRAPGSTDIHIPKNRTRFLFAPDALNPKPRLEPEPSLKERKSNIQRIDRSVIQAQHEREDAKARVRSKESGSDDADTVKIGKSMSNFRKSISAGSGMGAPSTLSGGAALQSEELGKTLSTPFDNDQVNIPSKTNRFKKSKDKKKKIEKSEDDRMPFKRGDTVRLHNGASRTGGGKITSGKKYIVHGEAKTGTRSHWVVPVGEKNSRNGAYHRDDRIYHHEDPKLESHTLPHNEIKKSEVLKIISNEAFHNFEKKEELISFLQEKLSNRSENEILAIAKTVAYVQIKKQELMLADMMKGSKNVREQRAKVFGRRSQPAKRSPMRDKHMQSISDFSEKFLGLKLNPSGGKIDEKTGERRDENPDIGVDKPDWRSGQLESQWNPEAAVHELSHIFLLPKGVGLEDGQRLMDKQYADVQKKYGYMKQKRSEGEVQPMAAEQLIRRMLGLPASEVAVPVKAGEPPRTGVEEPNREIATRVQRGKTRDGEDKHVDLIRQVRLLNPDNRKRIHQIMTGQILFHPEHGWYDNPDVNAKINARAMAPAGLDPRASGTPEALPENAWASHGMEQAAPMEEMQSVQSKAQAIDPGLKRKVIKHESIVSFVKNEYGLTDEEAETIAKSISTKRVEDLQTDLMKQKPTIADAHKKNVKLLIDKIKKQRESHQIKDTKDKDDHFNTSWDSAKNLFPEETHDHIKSHVREKVEKSEKDNVVNMPAKNWSKGSNNEHGNKVGTTGKTGIHEHGGIHRQSSMMPRSKGGVMTIVSSHLHSPDGDEVRHETKKDAVNFLNSLRKKTKKEMKDMPF